MTRARERLCIALLCTLIAAQADAQQLSLEVRGYAKNLAIRLSVPPANQAYLLNVSRFRARGLFSAGTRVRAEVWLDTELLAGSFLRSEEYARPQPSTRPQPIQLDWTVHSGTGYELRQRLFRAFAVLRTERVTVTVGRQRIAWGTGFAWNPTDILNPFNPGAIELGERAGVDAAHASVALGPLSRLELVAAHTEMKVPVSLLTRAGMNYKSYDLSVMAGRFRRDWVLGGDFAGYLGDAGVRGEAAYVWRRAASDYARVVLNADYTFRWGVYGLVEFHYNGRGNIQKSQYDLEDLRTGEIFNLARWYAAASLSAGITPLLGVGLYQLVNLNDGSTLAGPSVTYSLTQSMDISLATYLLIGASDAEYGAQRHVYFAALQWYY